MSALRRALEDALLADPDDRASHAAYADLLMESDDPLDIARGEFARIQLALEDEGLPARERRRLKKREAELLAEHERAWLGDLAAFLIQKDISAEQRATGRCNRWTWARGWLEEVSLFYPTPAAARALARCHAARMLRRLYLDHNCVEQCPEEEHGPDDPYSYLPEEVREGVEYPLLYLLGEAPFLSTLRVFRVGEAVDYEDDGYNSRHTSGEGVAELAGRMDRLEELYLAARNVDLASLFALPNLTRLRVLQAYHGLEEYPLGVLANNPALGALTTLRVHPAWSEDGPKVPRAEVRKLLRSRRLRALTHLYLRGSDLGDEGCEEIVESGILKRLEVLDLRHGCIQDDGARTLADCPDVRRLELLDLVGNELTEAGQSALQGLGIAVRCDRQNEVDSDAYLWTGDME